jgi:hypothetical protein
VVTALQLARHFTRAQSVHLDTSGYGTVTLAPASEDWIVTLTRVSCTGSTGNNADPIVTVYRSVVSPAAALEATYSGFGDQSDSRYFIQAGESVVIEWSGAPAGATGTVRLEGTSFPAGTGATAYAGGT